MEKIRGYCPLCISRCGSISTVDSGRLIKVEPDPDHPTGESFCIKGRAAPELVHSERRLLHPLMRTRPKGSADPGWRRVTWQEAMDYATTRLRRTAAQFGPEAVAFAVTTPSGTAVADAFGWIHRLAHAYGSPNVVFATENCNWHKDFATHLTFGAPIGTPDFDHAGCLLFWGFNPSASWPAYARAAMEARRRGARLVVVDPRRAGLAASADQWLPVRPGSDGILALAVAGVMIRNGWYDRDFVARWTSGPFLVRNDDGRFFPGQAPAIAGKGSQFVVWDKVRNGPVFLDPHAGAGASAASGRPALFGEFVLSDGKGRVACRPAFQHYADLCDRYPPHRAAALTGVPAQQIEDTARLLHESRPVSYYHWAGVCQQGDATQTGRAIGLLYALTGSFDQRGGNVRFATPPLNDVLGFELLPAGQLQKTLGRDRRPLGPPGKGWITSRDMARAVLEADPYPVRGLVSFGANPFLTKPHTPQLAPAMRALDFYIHADMFLNPSAAYADLVLPVASPWEREGVAAGFQLGERGSAWLQWRRAVLAPLGESRSDTDIVFELAGRLGLRSHFFGGDQGTAFRHLLAPTGVSMEELLRHPEGIRLDLATAYGRFRENGFATPTRRLEIYSQRLMEAGHAPVPEPQEDAKADTPAFPLRLTSAKSPQFCHSQHHALPSLRRRQADPLVEVHPDLARQKGIEDTDWVVIRTPVGAMRARARITRGIAVGTVCAQYGWWEDCPDLGLAGYALDQANYNALMDGESFDPASGSNALRGCPCDISADSGIQSPERRGDECAPALGETT
jgi:anaerobic selenocysteine-containing dehydrogenase